MAQHPSVLIQEIINLNGHIADAIRDKNFIAALGFDKIRQQHIVDLNNRKFALTDRDVDSLQEILDGIVQEINRLESTMLSLKSKTVKHFRTLKGYK